LDEIAKLPSPPYRLRFRYNRGIYDEVKCQIYTSATDVSSSSLILDSPLSDVTYSSTPNKYSFHFVFSFNYRFKRKWSGKFREIWR